MQRESLKLSRLLQGGSALHSTAPLSGSSGMVEQDAAGPFNAAPGAPSSAPLASQALGQAASALASAAPFLGPITSTPPGPSPSPNPTPKKKPKRQPLLTDWVKGTAVQRPQQLQKSSSAMGAATVSRSKAKYKCLGCQVPTLQKAEYAVKPGWLC
ncbi:TPA: hypothetical protein ACH3X2_005295 [Trebouxia sp. C0005]